MNKFELKGLKGEVKIVDSKKNAGDQFAFVQVITLGEDGAKTVEVALFDADKVAKIKQLEATGAKGLHISGTLSMRDRNVNLNVQSIEQYTPKF